MNTRVHLLGTATATGGAVLVFAGIQLVMLINGFAPLVFYASVVGLLLAPWFGYRFAERAVSGEIVRVTIRFTAEAIGAGGLVTTIVFWILWSLEYRPPRFQADEIAFALGATVAGCAIFGLFASVVLIPLAFSWIWMVRWLAAVLGVKARSPTLDA